jgi:5-methylcytosine-specific restriction endonuclease McrA
MVSTHRVSPSAGRVDARELPRGPQGRALCRTCGTEVPKGRRTFCSETCADDWAVRNSPSLMRRRVFQRDKGICALCGIDSAVLGKVLHAEWQRVKLARTAQQRRERADFRKRYRWFFRRTSYWDADHIIPVVEGGGECTMANIRTLCVPCHQQVTKDLARRRASQRRQQRRAGGQVRVALKIADGP